MRAWVGIVTLVAGVLVLIAGIIFILIIPVAVKNAVINTAVVDSPDHSEYDDFVVTSNHSIPYMRMTFWNLTNSDEVLAGTAHPIYEEAGPYVYTRKTFRQNITFLEDGDQVTFKVLNEYVFKPELSNGDPFNDRIVNLDAAYFQAIATAGSETAVAINAAATAFTQIRSGLLGDFVSQVFITGSVTVIGMVIDALGAAAPFVWTGTSVPSGVPPKFLLSNTTANVVSPTSAALLFNSSISNSLRSANQSLWIQYGATQDFNGFAPYLMTTFGLSTSQALQVFTWRFLTWESYVEETIRGLYSVANNEDLGYLQWGTGLVNHGTIQNLAGLPGIPEIGLYLTSIGVTPDSQFSVVAVCKQLLDSITDVTTLGTALLTYQATGQPQLGLTANQWGQFLAYYSGDILALFVDPELTGYIILTESPNNLLFGRVDPFIAIVSPSQSQVRGIWNDWELEKVTLNQIAEIYETGKADVSRTMYQITYEGNFENPYFEGNPPIQGGDGTFVGPDRIKEDDSVKVLYFSSDLARDVRLQYNLTYNFDGIELYRFRLDQLYETLQVGEKYHIESFGLANMREVGFGFDYVFSFPHFLYADPTITRDKVAGMRPNPDEHEVFIDIEPITGYGMKGSVALQANLYVPPLNPATGFNRWSASMTNNTYYPQYWLRIDKGIDEKLRKDFKDSVYAALDIGNIVGALLITVGILTGLIGAALLFIAVKK